MAVAVAGAVVEVEVAGEGDAEEAHRLLAVDEGDEAALAPTFQAADGRQAVGLEKLALQDRQEGRNQEEEPEEIEDLHDFNIPILAPAW